MLIEDQYDPFKQYKERKILNAQDCGLFKKNIQEYGISFLAAMHARQLLAPFLSYLSQAEPNEFIRDAMRVFLENGGLFFTCNFARKEIKQTEELIKKLQLAEEKQKDGVMMKILRDYIECKMSHVSQRKFNFKNFNAKHLQNFRGKNCFDQIAINWLNKDIEIIREMELCCQVYFPKNHKQKFNYKGEDRWQEFKNYRWPIELDNIKHSIRKTIAGFMNVEGGILYIGIEENKDSEITVLGMALSKDEKIAFFEFMRKEIIDCIFPVLTSAEERMEEKAHFERDLERIRTNQEIEEDYFLSRYCKICFINIVEEQTFMNVIQSNRPCYLVKIKVQQGNNRDLYHLINSEGSIDGYMKESHATKKLTFSQFRFQFEKRMEKDDQACRRKNAFHQGCQFRFDDQNVILKK